MGAFFLKEKIIQFISKIVNFGIGSNLHSFEKMRARVFNSLCLVGSIITFLNVIYSFTDAKEEQSITYILVQLIPFLTVVIALVIMYYSKINLAYVFVLTVFPILLLVINFIIKDRSNVYFNVIFMIYSFFFFDKMKYILPLFTISLLCFAYGTYITFYETDSGVRQDVKGFEVISFISAMVIFFVTLLYVKSKVTLFQKKIHSQRKELLVKNKKLEEQGNLLKQQNETLNKVFSIVSHDLRVPLEGLRLVLRSCKSEAEVKDLVSSIIPEFSNEISKMSNLFDNLISWAKLEMKAATYNNEEVDLNLIVNKVVNILRIASQQKEIKIVKSVLPNLKCYGDSNVIEIVLRNLVSNAIKFSKHESTVIIKAENVVNQLQLQVIDSGMGMSKNDIEKINEQNFYTTTGTNEEIGTGLGLMICSQMIKKGNGTLHIDSDLGLGTTVTVKLPSVGSDQNLIDPEPQINQPFLRIA